MPDSANDSLSPEEARELLGSQQSEEDLHRACVQWVNAQAGKYPELNYLFHPRGGAFKGTAQAGKMKGMGGKAGVPDFCLPVVSRIRKPNGDSRSAGGLWIELKSSTGRLRETQQGWRDFLLEHGHAWRVCRSMERFTETVVAYLEGNLVLLELNHVNS